MVFDDMETAPFVVQLIPLDELDPKTFNPADYMDFAAAIRTAVSPLKDVADVETKVERSAFSVTRVMSAHVDRATGQVLQPTDEEFGNITCRVFRKNDILFHKVRARIGRIGIADFEGLAETEFLPIRSHDIDPHYLTVAVRTEMVLRQLPFRETTRPRVRKTDIERLKVPRIGVEIERPVGSFLASIFSLRRRSHEFLYELMANFDKALKPVVPEQLTFLVDVDTLTEKTLNPGVYSIDILQSALGPSVEIGTIVEVIQPHALEPGQGYTAVALNDFSFEGIHPVRLQKAIKLWDTNYAVPGDVLYTKLHSRKETPGKATVILEDMAYLHMAGLTVDECDGVLRVPIYPEVFILRLKDGAPMTPFYLALALNSELFQLLFQHMMGGTSGRQRIRNSRLKRLAVPLLPEQMMNAFSDGVETCLRAQSGTFGLTVQLARAVEDYIGGDVPLSAIEDLIESGKERLAYLRDSLEEIENHLVMTSKATYAVEVVKSA